MMRDYRYIKKNFAVFDESKFIFYVFNLFPDTSTQRRSHSNASNAGKDFVS